MFRLFVHQGIVCKDMKLIRTYILDRDQLPNVIFPNFIPSFEFISWRGINTSQNDRSLNQFVFSHRITSLPYREVDNSKFTNLINKFTLF